MGENIQEKISDLINARINHLRPKLLDVTRRNPLISTKFSERSNSLIRVVDEVPELILESIVSDEMRIVPLPDLKVDPKDEHTREFQSALAEARLNDEVYLTRLDEIDQGSDEAPSLRAQAERHLKDRLREKLNMPTRQTKNNLSLQQHAKNHGISPHYELPQDNQQNEDGRHTDEDIQTLLLPDVLERRLNALCSKERTWKEETGISVLHVLLVLLSGKMEIIAHHNFHHYFCFLCKLKRNEPGKVRNFGYIVMRERFRRIKFWLRSFDWSSM